MKKEKWVRPQTIVEGFVASEYIAKCTNKITKDTLAGANCVNPNHYSGSVPSITEQVKAEHISGPGRIKTGRAENVFTEISVNCHTIIPTQGIQANNRYFPIKGDVVYELTDSDTNKTPNIFVYDPDNLPDICFGSFQKKTGSVTTVVPFS